MKGWLDFRKVNPSTCGQRVLHGLVYDGVDGAHKEVKRGEKLLTVLREIPLRFSVVEKLLLKLGRFVCEVRETFAKRVLRNKSLTCFPSDLIYLLLLPGSAPY